ncbi:hypothetical protein CVT24_004191 [Panaeolus cyanescens]|uniref:FAD/NAD(P)-binding domain-containing protein n=1 Tax=Panaeolus cyanescens TaxID=181874 RepID=A0A409W7V9_9AGAR|nr:hypothetical protein CVT24_004191 [Panaeolus cyanescens]
MSTPSKLHFSEAVLPTISKLGNPVIPADLDAHSVATSWLNKFKAYVEKSDVDGITSLMIDSTFRSNIFVKNPDGSDVAPTHSPDEALAVYWRDVLSLTWDIRTFESTPKIRKFLQDRLQTTKISNIELQESPVPPALSRPFPDIVWIQFFFTFQTSVANCYGIVRIVPFSSPNSPGGLDWKAHAIFTAVEDLKDFPELTGPRRSFAPNHGKWEQARKDEVAFADKDPAVLVVGAGHSGLETAARLKALGVSTLIIEKNGKIGDNWRSRYEALCLHDPVWLDHMPYIPFPPSWPVYTPAKKLANWLEHYAESLELNVWTSSKVEKATQDPKTKTWEVQVTKSDGTTRVFKVRHLVLAIGFKGGEPYIPSFPGSDNFKGQIIHSLHHGRALDHVGKKVVVVGACTSSHDICVDYADHNVDVTMIQRSPTYIMTTQKGFPVMLKGMYDEDSPPTEVADKIAASFPFLFAPATGYRTANHIAELDKNLLDGLKKRGFKVNNGFKGSCGLLLMVWTKAGGYYLDVGGSQYIIDGKIKLKNDSQIKEFTENGLRFEDGSELTADVVVFCTGLSDPRSSIVRLIGEESGKNLKAIWGLDEEGEMQGCFRDVGLQGLWSVMGTLSIVPRTEIEELTLPSGNFAHCRYYTKHLALQIKAQEEGIFGERY